MCARAHWRSDICVRACVFLVRILRVAEKYCDRCVFMKKDITVCIAICVCSCVRVCEDFLRSVTTQCKAWKKVQAQMYPDDFSRVHFGTCKASISMRGVQTIRLESASLRNLAQIALDLSKVETRAQVLWLGRRKVWLQHDKYCWVEGRCGCNTTSIVVGLVACCATARRVLQ